MTSITAISFGDSSNAFANSAGATSAATLALVDQWRERGNDMVQEMIDFDAYRRALSGLFHLRFRDGTMLKLDLYARNAEELAAEISEQTGVGIE